MQQARAARCVGNICIKIICYFVIFKAPTWQGPIGPRPTHGFVSPNIGSALGDIEMGRKPLALYN